MSELADLLERGEVYFFIPGGDRFSVLSALAKTMSLPASVDRKILAAALEEREKLASTAIGKGFAIPHTRNRIAESPEDSLLAIGYLDMPVEWDAPDGMPVSTLFLPLAADHETHLHILSRIAELVSKEDFRMFLKSLPGRQELLDYLKNPRATR